MVGMSPRLMRVHDHYSLSPKAEVTPNTQAHVLYLEALCAVLMLLLLQGLRHARSKPEERRNGSAEDKSILQALPLATAWIGIGACLIYLNKFTFLDQDDHGFGFPYPMMLCCIQMVVATVLTRCIACTKPDLMPAIQAGTFSWRQWMITIVPLGICLSGALILSNYAYLYLSVSYIQMLKAAGPVCVYSLSCLCGYEAKRISVILVLCGITFGVAGTSIGEANLNLYGLAIQLVAFFFDAVKLVLTKKMLSSQGCQLDPLSALYYFAPVCCCALGFGAFHLEGMEAASKVRSAYPILLANGLVAFFLQVASVYLMKAASATTYSLCSVVRDVGMVFSASLIFHTPLTAVQVVGYLTAILGIQIFNLLKEDPESWNNMLGAKART